MSEAAAQNDIHSDSEVREESSTDAADTHDLIRSLIAADAEDAASAKAREKASDEDLVLDDDDNVDVDLDDDLLDDDDDNNDDVSLDDIKDMSSEDEN